MGKEQRLDDVRVGRERESRARAGVEQRAVVLRLGRYVGLRGPGLFWVVPFIDSVSVFIDQRVITTGFAAEQTLTADTVPVNVDAVLFWMVHDPEKAALEVQNYYNTVGWAAQTALRDIIGKTDLARMLVGRESIRIRRHLGRRGDDERGDGHAGQRSPADGGGIGGRRCTSGATSRKVNCWR